MKHVLLQIGKHSSIYMVSQIVTNSLSVVMLPIYLHYFSLEEFGCMALIDLTMSLLAAALVSGFLSAVSRFHFEAKTVDEERTVWWTGLAFVAGTITVGSAVMIVSADSLALKLLGPEFEYGPLWLRLAAASLWVDMQMTVAWAYLRAKKHSAMIVGQSIARSMLVVACVVPGIMVWKLGLTALFLSNLIASAIILAVNYGVIAREWGRPRFSRPVFYGLWSYGWPLLLIGVLMTLMYSLNRWCVKEWIGTAQVGLLSLGIQVADKVNRLIVMPFQQIWGMLIYELHEAHPEHAIRTFCFVFELFCYVLISVFFGCSIAAGPVLTLIAKPEYLESVPLIPILCLAQFCLAVSDQFQSPMRLSKQTYLILPSAVTGVVTAGLMNWWLIPIFGAFGAAWATVATYFAFSAVNLLVARQIAVHPYPFRRIGLILAGVCGTFVAYQALESRLDSKWLSLGIGLTLWLLWTLAMAAISYRRLGQATIEDSTAANSELAAAVAAGEALN